MPGRRPDQPGRDQDHALGPQTTDEMILGYLENFVPAGSTETMGNRLGGRFDPATLFKRVDANGDGKISRAFVTLLPRFENNPDKARRLFVRLDADGGGFIPMEFQKLGAAP